jgi:hypothetical protein
MSRAHKHRCGNCGHAIVNLSAFAYRDLVCDCPDVDHPHKWVYRGYVACRHWKPWVPGTQGELPSPTSG